MGADHETAVEEEDGKFGEGSGPMAEELDKECNL